MKGGGPGAASFLFYWSSLLISLDRRYEASSPSSPSLSLGKNSWSGVVNGRVIWMTSTNSTKAISSKR